MRRSSPPTLPAAHFTLPGADVPAFAVAAPTSATADEYKAAEIGWRSTLATAFVAYAHGDLGASQVVVSGQTLDPYAPMDLTAALKRIETRFNLPALTKRDQSMPDMSEFFDFSTNTGPWSAPLSSNAASQYALHLRRADRVR